MGSSWEETENEISSRPDLLEQFRQAGFTDGLDPSLPAIGRMDELLLTLLSAFGDASGTATGRQLQSDLGHGDH